MDNAGDGVHTQLVPFLPTGFLSINANLTKLKILPELKEQKC